MQGAERRDRPPAEGLDRLTDDIPAGLETEWACAKTAKSEHSTERRQRRQRYCTNKTSLSCVAKPRWFSQAGAQGRGGGEAGQADGAEPLGHRVITRANSPGAPGRGEIRSEPWRDSKGYSGQGERAGSWKEPVTQQETESASGREVERGGETPIRGGRVGAGRWWESGRLQARGRAVS